MLFIFSSLGATYTHYYAGLTECIIYAFLIISLIIKDRKNWKTCIVLTVATILGYLPWLPIFIKQFTRVSGNWWLETFDSKTILSCITYIFDGKFTNVYLILIGSIFIEVLINIRKKIKN